MERYLTFSFHGASGDYKAFISPKMLQKYMKKNPSPSSK